MYASKTSWAKGAERERVCALRMRTFWCAVACLLVPALPDHSGTLPERAMRDAAVQGLAEQGFFTRSARAPCAWHSVRSDIKCEDQIPSSVLATHSDQRRDVRDAEIVLQAVLRVRGGLADGGPSSFGPGNGPIVEQRPADGAGIPSAPSAPCASGMTACSGTAHPSASPPKSGALMMHAPAPKCVDGVGRRVGVGGGERGGLLGPSGGETGDPRGGSPGDAWRMLHTGSRDGAAIFGEHFARIARALVDVAEGEREAQLEQLLEEW